MKALIGLVLISGLAQADYYKVANDGTVLPQSAALGSGAKDWACTYDSGTGLLWEVKTAENYTWKYAWYSTDPAINLGDPGQGGSSSCGVKNNCTTEGYQTKINTKKLCGTGDWRVPVVSELLSIVYCSSGRVTSGECDKNIKQAAPTVNPLFFPFVPLGDPPADYVSSCTGYNCSSVYWTNSKDKPTFNFNTGVYAVDFFNGQVLANRATFQAANVRLVSNTKPLIPQETRYVPGQLIVEKVNIGGEYWAGTLQDLGNGSFKLISSHKLPN